MATSFVDFPTAHLCNHLYIYYSVIEIPSDFALLVGFSMLLKVNMLCFLEKLDRSN